MSMLPLVKAPTSTACFATVENAGQLDVIQVLNADGSMKFHMAVDGSIDPPIFPQTNFTMITSAQLNALHTTPVTLIPAQVAVKGTGTSVDLFISPQYISMVYTAGKTPYSGANGGLFTFGWGSTIASIAATSAVLGVTLPDQGFVDQTTSQLVIDLVINVNGPLPLASVKNQPFSCYLADDTLTAGDGNLLITTQYSVVRATPLP
jgi:hypothetical protein